MQMIIVLDVLLDVISNCRSDNSYKKAYDKALLENKIPLQFKIISKFFAQPTTNDKIINKELLINKNIIKNLDFLLWEWKSPIAIEWYPFIMGLKHDTQIYLGSMNFKRISKTQTIPLSKFLIKNN